MDEAKVFGGIAGDNALILVCTDGQEPSMRGSEFAELAAFVAVAEERSFRRAAARLGMMPSTLSHSLRALETRLGVRLLHRTTRSVSPTEAGERLLSQLTPAFGDIARAVETVNDFRGRPAGTVRLNVPRMAAMMVLAPMLGRFAQAYPEVTLEVAVEDGFVDIVDRRFDAGIRLGEHVGREMISVRVSPDMRTAIVGSPAYFREHAPPRTPSDLKKHRCIGYRHISSGVVYRWELERAGETHTLAVSGPLVIDDPDLMTAAALEGVGLAYAVEAHVTDHLQQGRLIRVLEDWSPSFPGFFLYYPSRRHIPAALRALIEMLKV
ncbi:LysR family transcriptional regulator [Archangium violaceum]|uniref:LysR family transcriptional regulator n=1 Tax=Archangium violaceum TaxID=83451 RepID=UPI0037C173D2